MTTLEDAETVNTVSFLLFLTEELEDELYGADIDLSEVAQEHGFGSLGQHELNLALLEASGPRSLAYETFSNTPLNRRVLELLLEDGANIECRDLEGNSPLYRAILHDQNIAAEYLLESRAVVNDKFFVANDPEGETCLSTAVQLGNHALVKTLLKYGADLNSPRGIIFHCAANSDTYMLEILVDTGVNVVEVNSETEMTLLDTAFAITIDLEKAMHNYLDFVEDARPADTDISRTVLHSATMNARRYHAEKLRTIQYLLTKGSPAPSTMQIRHAFRLKAYHTLCKVYQYCIEARKVVEWPSWFYETTEESQENNRFPAESVDILREFIKRTSIHREGSYHVLEYLDEEFRRSSEDDKIVNNSLLMLKYYVCVNAIREYFTSDRHESVEASLNRLPLPHNLKNILTLQDLMERSQNQLDRFYDMFV